MAHLIERIDNEQDWHKARKLGIGGSDAPSVMGVNPYKSKLELWQEKTGRYIPQNISSQANVNYGKKAEAPLREIFMLDYPQYELEYSPYDIHINKDDNFIRASFDGCLTDTTTGEKGILEIKTTTIKNESDWERWDKHIPINYFYQIMHYFLIDEEFSFLKLRVHIRHRAEDDIEPRALTKHYHFKREHFVQELQKLYEEEKTFWFNVVNDVEPLLL